MEDRALALSLGVPGRGPWAPAATSPVATGQARALGALPATATWQHQQLSAGHCLPGQGHQQDRARGPEENGASGERLPSDTSASPPEGIRGIAVAAGARDTCPQRPGAKPGAHSSGSAHQHPPVASAQPRLLLQRRGPSPARLKESCWSRTALSPSQVVATAGPVSSPAPRPGATAEGLYLFRSSCLCS